MAAQQSRARIACLGVVWAGALATVAGFIMPWAFLDVSGSKLGSTLRKAGLSDELGHITATVRRGTREIAGRLPSVSSMPTIVSGIQIPQMANQEDAQLALAVMEMLTGKHEHLGAKSYAVYLLPGIALLGAAVVTLVATAPAAAAVAGACAAVAAVAFWKLTTTPMDTLFVAAKIGPGLWLSVTGYAVLAAAAFGIWLTQRRRQAR